jgi:DNA-binding NarL/FixJ family response regulator
MPDLLVIMLTVYEETDQVFKSLTAGAVGYLVKSVRPSHLLDAIREVHQGGSPMSSHIARKVVQAFQPLERARPAGERFSPREQQVLELLAKGDPYKQIADSMGISIETIRTYIRRIYEKLHVHSRIEAVVKYMGSQDHPQGTGS